MKTVDPLVLLDLERKWLELLMDVSRAARNLGAKEPFLYACEAGLVVLDGPPFGSETMRPRRDAVLFKLQRPPSGYMGYDSGGW